MKITRNLIPTITKLTQVPVVIILPPPEVPDPADSSGSGSDSDSFQGLSTIPESPSIQDKIDWFDQTGQISHQRATSQSEKRKAPESPETHELVTGSKTLTKSELRSLKKRQKKLKKMEYKEAEKKTSHN